MILHLSMVILIGCSGWSYDDWVGTFYPKGTDKKDWLGYYGRFFPTVEINSTFYAVPNSYTVEAWVRKGLAIAQAREGMGGFTYSMKLPQKITHELMVKGDLDKALEEARGFQKTVLDPLAKQNLLGALLVQTSPYFKADKEGTMKVLKGLLEGLDMELCDLAIELRHKSWLTKGRGGATVLLPEVAGLLKDKGVMLCETDGPGFPYIGIVTGGKVYLRFHGRNKDIWFKKGTGSSKGMETEEEGEEKDGRFNRYDYLYTEEELAPWKERLEEGSEDGFVYFNNHPRGKGPKNALMLMDLLGIRHEAKDIRISSQERLF